MFISVVGGPKSSSNKQLKWTKGNSQSDYELHACV